MHTEYRYDADQNLAGLKTTLGSQILANNQYRYDHNGNQVEKQQINGITRYTYDTLNQLSKVEYPSYKEELYYDNAGNRSRRVVGGVEELYRYDPRNRLTEYIKGGMATKLEYDKAGNLLVDDKARYTYDAFNRTEKVETFDGHVQINRYDAEGLRQELEEDGKLVQFIYRGDEVVAEKTEDNIIRLIRGYDLVASDAETARTYYHYASNELGSITHIANDCEILNRYEYDVWGNLAVCEETVPNRFLFAGQQYDPVTQQYYLRARFYNPAIARFTQEDTYRGDGLNLYSYCLNNPVCYVDPSGHWCEKKEQVYQELLKKKTAELKAENPKAEVDADTRLRLMAEASNIVDGKIIPSSGPILLPGPVEGGSGTKVFDIVRYGDKTSGLENHHGVLDVWTTHNVDGYKSRASDSITMALTPTQHAATKKEYRNWLYERTGKKVGGKVNWESVSPREIYALSERMFDAANVPMSARKNYYSELNRYLYGLDSSVEK